MSKVYVASCWTGAKCEGVYTTLEAAQQAIETHYKCLVMESPDMRIEEAMQWVPVHNDWAWVPLDYKPGIDHPWFVNKTPDGLMEGCAVIEHELDQPLPVV